MHRKNFLAVLLGFLCSLTFSSCSGSGDSAEKIVDEMIVQMDKMVGAIDSVKDKPSAEKGVADLKASADELVKLAHRAKAVGKVTGATKTKLEAKMNPKQAEFQKRMYEGGQRIGAAGDAAVLAILQKGFAEIDPIMKEFVRLMHEADR